MSNFETRTEEDDEKERRVRRSGPILCRLGEAAIDDRFLQGLMNPPAIVVEEEEEEAGFRVFNRRSLR